MFAAGQDDILFIFVSNGALLAAAGALHGFSFEFFDKLFDFVSEVLTDCFTQTLILIHFFIHGLLKVLAAAFGDIEDGDQLFIESVVDVEKQSSNWFHDH